jgi:hypothetical protein
MGLTRLYVAYIVLGAGSLTILGEIDSFSFPNWRELIA